MNNILNYNEYFKKMEESIVLDNINENKSSDKEEKRGGLRWKLNRRARKKVKAALQDEIEMSKSIMGGIAEALESLDESFKEIDKSLSSDEKKKLGDKEKLFENIKKIIDNSKKTSWNINTLIDEGEIDYAGFTSNVAYANIRYFGVMLFPITHMVLMKKAYNYFFLTIKNTIRKALIMLQLNFDQFENIILSRTLMSVDDYNERKVESAISEEYGNIYSYFFNSETGRFKNKKNAKEFGNALKAFQEKKKLEREGIKKQTQTNVNKYDSLLSDQYNNTYTKSLEVLKNYSQEDVQKQLDAIKTSMNKIAGGDVDMVAYSELLIAMAEEHAFKVSTSIYNKFAKMTEVFNLSNQKKLIDLIDASTKEREDAAEKERKEKQNEINFKNEEEKIKELEDEGKKIFERLGGKLSDEIGDDYLYEVKKIGNWGDEDAYELLDNGYISGKKSDERELDVDEVATMKKWFVGHPEVLSKCAESLQMLFPKIDEFSTFQEYVDALTSFIEDGLVFETVFKKPEKTITESVILNFDDYSIILENNSSWMDEIKGEDTLKDILDVCRKHNDKKRRLETQSTLNKLIAVKSKFANDTDKPEWYNALNDLIECVIETLNNKTKKEHKGKGEKTINGPVVPQQVKDEGITDDDIKKIVDDSKDAVIKYYINFNDINEANKTKMKKLFDKETIAKVALYTIGKELINDGDFAKRSSDILEHIITASKEGKCNIHKNEYDILNSSISKIKYEVSHDYPILRKVNQNKNDEDKEKKSEE